MIIALKNVQNPAYRSAQRILDYKQIAGIKDE